MERAASVENMRVSYRVSRVDGVTATIERQISVPTASRRARFVVVTLALATFGPYIIGGLRTDQIVAYGLFLVLAPLTLPNLRVHGGNRFLIPWVLYIAVATLGVLFPSISVAPWDAGSVVGGYDNLLLPVAVMLLIWSVVPDQDAGQLLVTFSKIIATAMALNGVLAIIATRYDIAALLRPFWSTADAATTTAELAAQLGRYGGVFNQPAEAGALYGLAGLAAIYAWRNRPVLLAMVLTLITIGGLLSVSKVFILGGLPFVVIYWLWAQRGKAGSRVAALFAIGIATLGVIQSGLLGQWIGFNYLARLVNPEGDGGALAFYTAGRIATDSGYMRVIDDALTYNPVTGVGAGGWLVAYDGAIPEALVTAGVIGVALYAFVIVATFTLARRGVPAHERMFAFMVAVITAGACFGFSPLTANRVSTVVWVLIALLVISRRHHATQVPMTTIRA